ncbi:MAG TPA: hypothetical protein VGN81_10915 [Pseudonocardiaceae bacterium]|jgi:hypothetical protein
MSISEIPTSPRPRSSESGKFLRPLLWLLLAIGVTGDVIASAANLVVVNIAFGLLALATGSALAVQHYRSRKRRAEAHRAFPSAHAGQ